MFGYHTPVVKALLCTAKITTFPKLKHILISLVADSSAVAQYHFGKIIIENTLDILGALVLVGYTFVKCTDFIFGGFQVGCGCKDFTDSIIVTEERKASVLVASVVIL